MACDMSEPCKFLPRYNCQKRFLWTHKEVDLAPRPVVGLVLQVGVAEKFPQALRFQRLILFFQRASKQDPCLTATEEDGSYRSLVELERF